MDGANMHSETRVLGEEEFNVVGEFVQPVTVDTPLLYTEFVEDGAHDDLVPLDKGPPVFKSVVEEDQALPSGYRGTCLIFGAGEPHLNQNLYH